MRFRSAFLVLDTVRKTTQAYIQHIYYIKKESDNKGTIIYAFLNMERKIINCTTLYSHCLLI